MQISMQVFNCNDIHFFSQQCQMYHFFKAITGQYIQRNCSMYSICMHYTYKKEDSVIQSSNACILCLLTPAVPCCSMHRGGFCPFLSCQFFITQTILLFRQSQQLGPELQRVLDPLHLSWFRAVGSFNTWHISSWATDKMATIFTQNDNFNNSELNSCHFVHLLIL